MGLIPNLYRAARRHLWSPVEPALVNAGREGEVAAAQGRIGMALFLGVSPLITLYQDPGAHQALLSLPLVGLFVAVGFWTLWLARREPHPSWASYAGSASDITLVSAYQMMLFLDGLAYVAMGSRATFTLYVFAIIATGLRYDPRLVVGTGLLAAVQWMGVMVWADSSGLGASAIAGGRFYPSTRLDG